MVFYRKGLVFGEGALENCGDHGSSLWVSPTPTDQMAVYEHHGLIIDLKPHTNGTFVSGCAQSPSLDSAQLKRFGLEPSR